jgi:hypothetical protein
MTNSWISGYYYVVNAAFIVCITELAFSDAVSPLMLFTRIHYLHSTERETVQTPLTIWGLGAHDVIECCRINNVRLKVSRRR